MPESSKQDLSIRITSSYHSSQSAPPSDSTSTFSWGSLHTAAWHASILQIMHCRNKAIHWTLYVKNEKKTSLLWFFTVSRSPMQCVMDIFKINHTRIINVGRCINPSLLFSHIDGSLATHMTPCNPWWLYVTPSIKITWSVFHRNKITSKRRSD